MTSKLVVNTIEADTGISSVSFASSISMNSTAKFHFSAAGIDIGADTNINRPAAGVLGFNVNGAEKVRIDSSGHMHGVGVVTATHFYGDGSNLTGISSPAITSIGSDGANRVLTSDGDGTATAHSFVTIENNRLSVNRGSGSGAFPLIVRRTDASGIIAEFANSSGYGLLIGQNSATGEAYLRTGTGQPMVFTTNSGSGIANERLRITSDGKLTLNYAATPPSEDFMICTAGQASPAGVSISHLSGGNRYGLRLQSVSGTNAGITFSPFINSSYQDFMRITYDTTTNDGKLGINNLSPSYALDIQHTGANQANAAVSRFRQITDNGGEDHALMLCRHAGARPGSNGVDLLFQNSGGTTVGKIDHGHSTTQYRTSSDYRLKENAVSISDGITRLKKLKPYRFNFIAEPDKIVDGFFAHEAAVAVPEAVSGTKDEVDSDNNPIIQGIDHSKLVPLLTASLQEAIAKIETLESEVAALKGS
tara:strand:- start:277 stop:1710 length:1434 start_codon:yes stop_codon:yes gene_type:complete